MKKIVIFDFNRTLYDPEKGRVMRGARKVIKFLTDQGFTLFLISAGQKTTRKTIEQTGMVLFFEKITVSKSKSLRDFRKFITPDVSLKNSYVIGDRVKSEIKKGNQLKMRTIWICKGKFARELPTSIKEQPTFTVSNIMGVLEIIS